MDKPFIAPALVKQSAQDAYETVLNESGAILPARDSVDLRIINSVRSGTGKVIQKETDLAPEDRWPDYHTLPAPTDTIGNGIPDFWKQQFGIDKNDPASAMKITAGGYANIEHYLNNTDPTGGAVRFFAPPVTIHGEQSAFSIADIDALPKVEIVYAYANVSRADSGGRQPGEITVTRTGNDSADLIIRYDVGGTAEAGGDYVAVGGTVTIPAHQRTAQIKLTPSGRQDSIGKTIVIELKVQPETYHVGCPAAAMVVIRR